MEKKRVCISQPCGRCGCNKFIVKRVQNDDWPLFYEPPSFVKRPLPDYSFVCTRCGNKYVTESKNIFYYVDGFTSRYGRIK